MHVYPAMRKHLPDGEQAVEHDIEEHKELEATDEGARGPRRRSTPASTRCCARLEHRPSRTTWPTRRATHFPQLRAALPREELVALAAKVEAAKKLAPTRPHPGAPNTKLFHKVVGPGVGFVDRLRDKLSGRTTS